MLPLNPALLSGEDYLFARIAAAAAAEQLRCPHRPVLSLGIGDVTRPIAPVAAEAMRTAAAELASENGQRGYGPAAGYPFLQRAIAARYDGLPCPNLSTGGLNFHSIHEFIPIPAMEKMVEVLRHLVTL